MQITRLFAATLFVLGISHGQLYGQAPQYFAPQSFVAVTPCRIVDTRTTPNPGPIRGGQSRNFDVMGNSCQIPSTAAAYSLNITVVPPPGGILQYLTVYPAVGNPGSNGPPNVSTLNDYEGTVVANAAIVGAGYNGQITIYVTDTTNVIIDINGYFVDQTNLSNSSTAVGTGALSNNTGGSNTGVGSGALPSASGGSNTAVGSQALYFNTTANDNTGFGFGALLRNDTGSYNTAVGSDALTFDQSGKQNVAVGAQAGAGYGTFSYATAVGYRALFHSTADLNTGIGYQALDALTTGTSNSALGANAGSLVTTGSNNIEIGSEGSSADNGFIRIGTPGTQTMAFIAGISGMTVTGAAVLVNSSGQLGVQSSSIRYKEDVHDMADGSGALMKLRPVEFRYKQAEADGSKPLQFGLVAEEVARVYPQLVVRGKDGQVDTVQYHQLPAMLLNELQKQQRTIEDLKKQHSREIQNLEDEIQSLRSIVSNKVQDRQ